ncbi:MAG: hypothetical protein ACXVAX_04085 [Pseudobdellovibrio sp.]
MISQSEIINEVILPCLEKACSEIPNFKMKGDSLELILFGRKGAVLDSLNLVNFIFLIEDRIQTNFKIRIKFETDDILNKEQKPFLNIENLAGFLEKKMNAVHEL